MTHADYWDEAVECAFHEAGVTATKEQMDEVAGSMDISSQQVGMAFGPPIECGMSDAQREVVNLKRELAAERSKTTCHECKGRGRIVTCGPVHSYDSECSRCRGEGRG